VDEFRKGDVVQLKSGGPSMTVANVGDYSAMGTGPKDGVKCDWFEKNVRKTEVLIAPPSSMQKGADRSSHRLQVTGNARDGPKRCRFGRFFRRVVGS